MTRDEATGIWMASFNAWCEHPLPANERVAREAAATVIQQAFAERDGEIERLRDGLEQSLQGWENVAELNLIPGRYMDGAIKLAKVCRQALAAKGDSRG